MAAPVSFSKQIVPILADQCLECHRAEKAKGSYRLDTFEQLLKTGDSDAAPIVPGKAEESELYELLVADDDADRMPKKADALPEKDIALIRQWINEGAKFDGQDDKAELTSLLPQKKNQSPEKYPQPIPVTAMALNGDGKVLVTSGYHEVLAWDPETGKLRTRLSDMPERVLGLSFVKGGPWLAVAGGSPGRSGEVWLVNFAKPTERKRLAQMRDCALGVVTSPDGKYLVSGGADNRIRCYTLPEGKEIWNLEAHADWILAVAMSPDGSHVATASRDRTAKVMKTATREIEGTFTAHSVPVLSIAFAPDGQTLISGDADGQARPWGLDGKGVKDTTLRPAGRSAVLAVSYLDGNTPLTGSASGQVSVIDAKTRKTRSTLAKHEDRVNALLVFGAGEKQKVITASHDGEVRVSSSKDNKELGKFIASPGW
ncbi:c-type cytochrome domain-containing protein [Prosthecobacter sp. SYSU 5D2]|uniref:c-type cytochrome domain-containing protein n=1 Tax=Prosthecobacter sp. SYSU 5D2 TaxID=3134134 RepID=UPI0031FE865C